MSPFCNLCLTDSIPGVGGDKEEDSGLTKEEMQEQERQRQEAIKEARCQPANQGPDHPFFCQIISQDFLTFFLGQFFAF